MTPAAKFVTRERRLTCRSVVVISVLIPTFPAGLPIVAVARVRLVAG